MDVFDQATEFEMRERARCLASVVAAPAIDYESRICPGCSYATETNFGKACDGWADCLQDEVKRERAGR